MADIKWGGIYSTTTNFAFRLGLLVDTVVSNAQVKANIQVWFWSQYAIDDGSVNLFYRTGQGITTAYDEAMTYRVSTPSVKCTGNTGSGWSTGNQIKLYSASHTYPRDTSAKTINIYAHVGDIYNYSTSKGGLITVSTSVTIPALPTYTITYNGNGATGGSTASSTHTYGASQALTANGFTKTGHTFKGWNTKADGSGISYSDKQSVENLASTDGAIVILYAMWVTNTYTNNIHHWAYGWQNGEGNNAAGNSFKLKTDPFDWQYGTEFTLAESRATTIPNGFYLNSGRVYSSYDKKDYIIGSKVEQVAGSMNFEYYYYLYTYEITYNLEGGSFDIDPPTAYNILYEVLFPTPKRAGYSFVGWYVDGGDLPVSGVNVGANASFTSAEDLYAKLATRTTGNITVTARWADNGTAHVKQDGVWKKGQVWFKGAGIWKRGIPWVKVNGEWKRGGA